MTTFFERIDKKFKNLFQTHNDHMMFSLIPGRLSLSKRCTSKHSLNVPINCVIARARISQSRASGN